MKKLFLSVILFCTALIYAQSITLGTQVWMTKNLDVTTFRNGDRIPQAKTVEEWIFARENKQPAWCYYENKKKNGKKYGKLYNWYAVSDPRGLAPAGWHVPSDGEWTVLTDFLGGGHLAGTKMDRIFGFSDSYNPWRSSNGVFYSPDEETYETDWWSSTDKGADLALCRSWNFSIDDALLFSNETTKGVGISVRCLKD